ncbi:MAG: hypothetical protein IJY52_02715 [Anaerotignum sp.]|nr:hypothetical protein [Anaerotignum sp.]
MFKVKDRQITGVEPFEYLPVTAGEEYALGEALTKGENGATKCAADAKPGYICMGPGDGTVVPVMPVLATTRFEVPYDAVPAVGAEVTLGADALTVTATTGGAFTVTDIDEAAGTVCGYFK